jgi:hypothetical protein
MTYPDWQSGEDYEFTTKLSHKGWAWEFLRRSSDYRSAYESFSLEAAAKEVEYGPDWQTNPDARDYVPPILEGESPSRWMMRCELTLDQRARREWLHILRGEPFGLIGMFDPISTSAETVNFANPRSFPLIVRRPEELDQYTEEKDVHDPVSGEPTGASVIAYVPSVCVVAIDLTQSIATQIDEMERGVSLVRKRRQMKKPHLPALQQEWPRYLRVLDADLDGATDEKIAGVLWPVYGPDEDPVGRVRETRKQAKRWTRYSDYSRLLLAESTPKN